MLRKLFLIFFCLLHHIAYANEIPKQIEQFFNLLLHTCDFSYTLIGEKPVSIITFPYDGLLHSPVRSSLAIRPAFDLVENLNLKYPTQHFIWVQLKAYDSETFALIHKKSILSVLQSNRSVFDLGNKEIDDQIITEIVTNCLRSDSRLDRLGLLLGYGKSNSRKFEEQNLRLHTLSSVRFSTRQIPDRLNQLPLYLCEHMKRNQTNQVVSQMDFTPRLVDEIVAYEENMVILEQLSKESSFSLIRLPVFMVDKNETESWDLYRKYQKARVKISSILNSGKKAENTLKIYQEGA